MVVKRSNISRPQCLLQQPAGGGIQEHVFIDKTRLLDGTIYNLGSLNILSFSTFENTSCRLPYTTAQFPATGCNSTRTNIYF